MTQLSNQMQDLSSAFARDGYVTLPNVVSKSRLAALTEELRGEYTRARAAGELFSGGGTISGHLNCFPGAQSRFVYDELERYGVFDFVRKLSPSATRMPNVGCNLNLPNSSAQNPHADGNVAIALHHRERRARRYGPREWRDGGCPRYSLARVQILAVRAFRKACASHAHECRRRDHPVVFGLAPRDAEQEQSDSPNARLHLGRWRQRSCRPLHCAWRQDHVAYQPLRSEPQRAAARTRFCLAARAGKELFVHSLSCSVGGRRQAITILEADRFTPACAHKARQSLKPCAAA